jgi:hypothetical protein
MRKLKNWSSKSFKYFKALGEHKIVDFDIDWLLAKIFQIGIKIGILKLCSAYYWSVKFISTQELSPYFSNILLFLEYKFLQ